ncbi:hypothetical protein GV67_16720 [Pseudorhizobium pelagicum]|nr:hypothetical protein GV67_16720 [Pseudorhizobium pelagicum]
MGFCCPIIASGAPQGLVVPIACPRIIALIFGAIGFGTNEDTARKERVNEYRVNCLLMEDAMNLAVFCSLRLRHVSFFVFNSSETGKSG